MEKFGFVYLWFDRRYSRFYLGCHWGHENDGYICSSPSMREAYRRRKEDFRCKILSRVYTNRHDLLTEEQRFLDMIKPEDFGKKFYNINTKATFYAWWMNEDTKAEVGKKIAASQAKIPGGWGHWKIGYKHSKETRRKMSRSQKGMVHTEERCEKKRQYMLSDENKLRGRPLSQEHIKKLSDSRKGVVFTTEHKEKISRANTGRKHTEESKKKMSEACKGRVFSEEHKQNLRKPKRKTKKE